MQDFVVVVQVLSPSLRRCSLRALITTTTIIIIMTSAYAIATCGHKCL